MATSMVFVGIIFFALFYSSGYLLKDRESHETYLTHTIQLSSLLPSSVCNHSSKADERNSTLKVVNKHGPCFQSHHQSRVNNIQSKLSTNSTHRRMELDATIIPVKDGEAFKSGNFLVRVGFGTEKTYVSLEIDTGSGITWTQCEPCNHCYDSQKEPRYNRESSRTFVKIPCSDSLCDIAPHEDKVTCRGIDCAYKIRYVDKDTSEGFFAKETLILPPSEVLKNFKFGCGTDQNGNHLTQEAGLLGLDRSQVSLISQTASKYKNIFSYCLPSSPSNTGHLTFGSHRLPANIKFTKMITAHSTLYGLGLTGISVEGKKIPIAESIFKKPGTVIDSGTTLTYLPSEAHRVVKKAFQNKMSNYPKAPPASDEQDVCYDVRKYPYFKVPKISLYFEDGTEVMIPEEGSFSWDGRSKVCLAMVRKKKAGDYTIIGNTAQKSMEIVYDIPNERIGFGLNGCN